MAQISSTLTQQVIGYLNAVHQVCQSAAGNAQPEIMSSESLVLRYGRSFSQRVRTQVRGMKGKCFQTCYDWILENDSLTYCEGYAICNGLVLPVLHAWLVCEQGQVHDPTWKLGNNAYFGVELERKFVLDTVAQTKSYGIISSDFRLDFSLHRNGFPAHALARQFHQS
ncbi:hypothetical protein NG796_24615 [Laspinema sp. A4]|uniref:hypothetical protein n=1 Tax=Laspinema sp. D2d TaxID=2953686 RepID=UPI0021BACAF9|nr:hypothetical protein [Laspinema sp. D2d]MCT7986459.1 hypothetical protein [Laspinema sp. D2d]